MWQMQREVNSRGEKMNKQKAIAEIIYVATVMESYEDEYIQCLGKNLDASFKNLYRYNERTGNYEVKK